jgi:hypothetical protein
VHLRLWVAHGLQPTVVVLFFQKACTLLLTVVKKIFVPINLAATRELGLGPACSSITQREGLSQCFLDIGLSQC